MKSQPMHYDGKSSWTKCEPAQATHLKFNIPGPTGELCLPVNGARGWQWNGSVDAPTLQPSILSTRAHEGLRCHSFLTNGTVQFLDDTTHEFKGQTVELLELDES